MLNWLGQNVKVGSVVFRGARQGNTSSHKIGVVETLNDKTRKVRVSWKYECGGEWIRPEGEQAYYLEAAYELTERSKGTCDVGPLVVVPEGLLKSAERMVLGTQIAKARKIPASEIDNFIMI